MKLNKNLIKEIIISILILFFIFMLLSLIFVKATYSYGSNKYITEYIVKGDTLWQIAKSQKSENAYYKNKSIEYIVYDLQKVNNLENSALKEGQKILIPII